MHIKSFVPRVMILSAAVLSAVSLSACAGGVPVKGRIPSVYQTAGDNEARELSAVLNASKKQKDKDKPKQESQSSAATSATEKPQEKKTEPAKADNRLEKKDNKGYYYQNGELQKGGVVGDETNGYYYANQNGEIDFGYCDGVEDKGVNWNVIEGKATKAESESDQVLFQALKAVAKYTKPGMTRDEKLRACFDHMKTDYLEGVLHDPPYQELDWPVVYANDIYINGKGDCFSYGAAFAYIGKAIGFENCYACNSGGHGWAEIDGKYYDPEWDMHHNEYNHFGVKKDDPCDVDYVTTLVDGVDWMHVKI